MKTSITKFLIFLVVILPGACARLDPQVIQAGSNDYNIAMQSSRDEQMLLNLVRLKYNDTPYFLEASSVASQFRLSSEANASANLSTRPISDTVGVSGNIAFVEQPTVTYTPLQGNDFVQRLLLPITLDTVMLLVNSGWSAERVLRLTVEKINGIPNGPGASGPTPALAPEFEAFVQLVAKLETLRKRDQLQFVYRRENDDARAVMKFSKDSSASLLVNQIKTELGIAEGLTEFQLIEGKSDRVQDKSIVLTTRSLLGVLFYLSHSVNVPDADKQAGIVKRTLTADGAEFDWALFTENLFRVASQGPEAGSGKISTTYRGHRFYIDDRDINSKSTFSLLTQLFSLQAGNAEGTKPVLTIPVGS